MSGIDDPLIPLSSHKSCMAHEEVERCRGNCALSFLHRLLCDDSAGPVFISFDCVYTVVFTPFDVTDLWE